MTLLWLMPQQASALFLDRPQCTDPRALSSKKPLNSPLLIQSRIDVHNWRTGYRCKCELPWSLLVAYSPANRHLLGLYIRQGCKGLIEANRQGLHKKTRGLKGGCPCPSSKPLYVPARQRGLAFTHTTAGKGAV